jgi:hypothetical protein
MLWSDEYIHLIGMCWSKISDVKSKEKTWSRFACWGFSSELQECIFALHSNMQTTQLFKSYMHMALKLIFLNTMAYEKLSLKKSI